MTMVIKYSETRRAAYRLKPGTELIVRYRTLGFPERLSSAVLDVCNLDRADGRKLLTAPTRRLNGSFRRWPPTSRCCAGTPQHERSSTGWLYHPAALSDPLPEYVRRRLLSVWLEDLRREPELQERVQEALSVLDEGSQDWSYDTVDLLGVATSPGGTAVPTGVQYTLTTDHFARRSRSGAVAGPTGTRVAGSSSGPWRRAAGRKARNWCPSPWSTRKAHARGGSPCSSRCACIPRRSIRTLGCMCT